MENELSQVHKTKIIYQTFFSNLMWYFLQAALLPGAQPGAGHLGHLYPRNFQNTAQKFWHLQNLSKDKDEISYSFFKEILLEFFFVLLVNYLLTRFILRQVIWSKISLMIGI